VPPCSPTSCSVQMCGCGSWEIARASRSVEAFAEVGIGGERVRQYLDRHCSIESRVSGLVHLAHPPAADQGQDLVGAEPGAGAQGHGRGVPEYSWFVLRTPLAQLAASSTPYRL
jgi:hypothetical protein